MANAVSVSAEKVAYTGNQMSILVLTFPLAVGNDKKMASTSSNGLLWVCLQSLQSI